MGGGDRRPWNIFEIGAELGLRGLLFKQEIVDPSLGSRALFLPTWSHREVRGRTAPHDLYRRPILYQALSKPWAELSSCLSGAPQLEGARPSEQILPAQTDEGHVQTAAGVLGQLLLFVSWEEPGRAGPGPPKPGGAVFFLGITRINISSLILI